MILDNVILIPHTSGEFLIIIFLFQRLNSVKRVSLVFLSPDRRRRRRLQQQDSTEARFFHVSESAPNKYISVPNCHERRLEVGFHLFLCRSRQAFGVEAMMGGGVQKKLLDLVWKSIIFKFFCLQFECLQ